MIFGILEGLIIIDSLRPEEVQVTIYLKVRVVYTAWALITSTWESIVQVQGSKLILDTV